MGWKPGEGLGKNQSGSLEPLLLDVKMDKRGEKNFQCWCKVCGI